MSELVPQLFDPVKAEAALARAARSGPERFLLDRLAADLSERLAAVTRRFGATLDFGTPAAAFGLASGAAPEELTILPPAIARDPGPADLPAARFDRILSGGLFHQVNDLPGLLARLRRALVPDGLMMAAFPGGDTLWELRAALVAAESELRGAAGLRVFPMVDLRAAGQLLQRAGFALPVVDSETVIVRYATPFALIRDLRAMGAGAAPLRRPGQPGLTRAIILRAAEIYAERHADPDGRLRATFEFIWMSGWAPHESQQKPLRPGSAKTRLADALREIEQGKREA
ncbi:SAM-dependent methyltransferase [Rhabdaerophilum calidifontis]|uniref:SAM-dependent methyltransferase n=1 Tax=Rhabdaerophilum calidifontis TaxID=2604328 RepID=UPI00123ABACD|nr:SAM-dependent methyltransferase [Rhabdaerophilum calidifontis]